MNAPFQFTPQATEDLDEFWWFIAEDNREAADRVEMEIVATRRRVAKHPLMGTKRLNLTPLPVRFWAVTKYVIVYRFRHLARITSPARHRPAMLYYPGVISEG